MTHVMCVISGFILGLISGSSYIRGSGFKNVLVVGADALSCYVDWTYRGTCILFGDVAGNVFLQILYLTKRPGYKNENSCWCCKRTGVFT
ncbi:beta-ketoacyl-[acyl-carrier-protein] synthase III, chloroplastic-like [Apium graveolens]|uniref:beta-ketoacyl-[acyl-carrier-protein] synthase III, chloroplastic-like n=1 Tax=Apium graveolens TaxID=4045 RepID=UPI003D7ACD99